MAVQEILVGSTPDQIFVAMEFVEHDMKSLLETMTQPFLVRAPQETWRSATVLLLRHILYYIPRAFTLFVVYTLSFPFLFCFLIILGKLRIDNAEECEARSLARMGYGGTHFHGALPNSGTLTCLLQSVQMSSSLSCPCFKAMLLYTIRASAAKFSVRMSVVALVAL